MHELFEVRVLARPDDVEPGGEGHRVIGVLNPGSTWVEDRTRLLLRVIEAHDQNGAYHEHFRSGSPLPEHVYLPRAQGSGVHWEKKRLGEEDVIPDVAFPTGAHILPDGTLEVYLGLNDAVTAVARAPLSDVLAHLQG